MNLRRVVYREIYLNTPGWALTRLLRKARECRQCGGAKNLHLHHDGYPFFAIWYPAFFVAIFLFAFDVDALWALAFLLCLPDVISPTRTLCARCHRMTHGA
jgi:uncharacterized protein (DUF983 family)